MFSKKLSNIFSLVSTYILFELSSLMRFNYVVGSQHAYFSFINCSTPLARYTHSVIAFMLMTLRKLGTRLIWAKTPFHVISMIGLGPFNPLLYYIPSIIASSYWSSNNTVIKRIVPVLCIAAFIAHPIGYQAMAYASFWLIPFIISFISNHSIFLRAIGTTFMAHAIGSLLYLYLQPMPAEYWLGLMPRVIVERLVFALGITCVYYAVQLYTTWAQNINTPKSVSVQS